MVSTTGGPPSRRGAKRLPPAENPGACVSDRAGLPEPAEYAARVDRRFTPVYHSDEGGPLELLHAGDHALVRAMMISTRRWRTRLVAVNSAIALLACLAVGAGFLLEGSRAMGYAGKAGAAFLCVWPLAMLLGAALRSAGRVVAERTEGTAIQLVLTPLEKRSIAAAMVLPHAAPFLWGLAAALPLYVLVGGSLNWGALPSPWVFWPFRFAVVPFTEIKPTASGAVTGLIMCATDVALVWAALHWGAAYAVRVASLTALGPYLLWRLLLTTLLSGLCYLALGLVAAGLWLAVRFVGDEAIRVTGALIVGFLALGLWWRFLLPRTVKFTLQEFAHFDRLADEEFRIKPVRFFSMFRDYGERP